MDKFYLTLKSARNTIDELIRLHGENTIVESFEISINKDLKLESSTTSQNDVGLKRVRNGKPLTDNAEGEDIV